MALKTQAAVVGTDVSIAAAGTQARKRSADAAPSAKGGRGATVPQTPISGPLSADLLLKMNAYWRAANYLSVG